MEAGAASIAAGVVTQEPPSPGAVANTFTCWSVTPSITVTSPTEATTIEARLPSDLRSTTWSRGLGLAGGRGPQQPAAPQHPGDRADERQDHPEGQSEPQEQHQRVR